MWATNPKRGTSGEDCCDKAMEVLTNAHILRDLLPLLGGGEARSAASNGQEMNSVRKRWISVVTDLQFPRQKETGERWSLLMGSLEN